jgi:hypothetical protein
VILLFAGSGEGGKGKVEERGEGQSGRKESGLQFVKKLAAVQGESLLDYEEYDSEVENMDDTTVLDSEEEGGERGEEKPKGVVQGEQPMDVDAGGAGGEGVEGLHPQKQRVKKGKKSGKKKAGNDQVFLPTYSVASNFVILLA